MESNVADKKKVGAKAKKNSSAREQKEKTLQRNIMATIVALQNYRQKKALEALNTQR